MSDELQIINEVQSIQIPVVVDEVSREEASGAIIDLKTKRARIVEYWKPLKERAFQAHKEVTQREKEMLSVVDGVINQINDAVKAYLREQERIRIEAQRKAEEEARKKAEEERARIEAEQQKAIEAGNIEKAMELEETPPPVVEVHNVAPIPQRTVRIDAGTSTVKKELVVDIVDPLAFLRYCANAGLLNLWDVKAGAVKTWVKATGFKEVPGLNIYEDVATQYRRARA